MKTFNFYIVLCTILVLAYVTAKDQKTKSRCNKTASICRDGDGMYQYKGRGSDKDNISVLLGRIIWLAGHHDKTFTYHTSFTTSTFISIGLLALMMAFGIDFSAPFLLSIFLLVFLMIFSMQSLHDFHTARYSHYYTKFNARKVLEKLKLKEVKAPPPTVEEIPHRTVIRTFLEDKKR